MVFARGGVRHPITVGAECEGFAGSTCEQFGKCGAAEINGAFIDGFVERNTSGTIGGGGACGADIAGGSDACFEFYGAARCAATCVGIDKNRIQGLCCTALFIDFVGEFVFVVANGRGPHFAAKGVMGCDGWGEK